MSNSAWIGCVLLLLGCVATGSSEARCDLRRVRRATGGVVSSLYTPSDRILELNASSFNASVFGEAGGAATLVEFYSSWCGHCRRFAPLYAQFARDVHAWRRVARVAAVNCADTANQPVCADNGVRFVPFLKYFPRNALNAADGYQLQATHSVPALRRQLADAIVDEHSTQGYPDWPNFDLMNDVEYFRELWAGVDESVQHLAVVFENGTSSVGAEVMLDLSDWAWVAARRAASTHSLVAAAHLVEFPAVAVYDRRHASPIYVSEISRLFSGAVQRLNPSMESEETLVDPDDAASALQGASPTNTTDASKFFVSETDMLLAAWGALYREVIFHDGQLTADNVSALINFTQTLADYFPLSMRARRILHYNGIPTNAPLERSDRARSIFHGLVSFLKGLPRDELSTEDWKTEFERLEVETSLVYQLAVATVEVVHGSPFPTSTDWQHCKGSDAKYRGFTCGLWTTFHALTVHAYVLNFNDRNFDPSRPIRDIAGWVEHFFGCRECANHFGRMTRHTLPMDDWIHRPSDVVFYLWRAHNHVNERLGGDVTEDPIFPKRQFPPPFLCQRCREDDVWSSADVMRFMQRFYTDIRPHDDGAALLLV